MASVATINNLGAYAHNPRGNLWFNDESTYGHKLLKKMGWHKGKGLGKNEDGIKENVKVKIRNTNSGLGFKNDAYANVMKTEYETILQNLNSESIKKPTTFDENTNKQQTSRVIKSKMRYPKLFFGKDVTKYTEKDMKSIFICSQLFKDNEKEDTEGSALVHNKNSENKLSESKSFATYSSNLSISDYFAKKMQEKKSKMLDKSFSNGSEAQGTSLESESTKTENLLSNTKTSKRKRKELEMNCSGDLAFHQNCDSKAEPSLESESTKAENLASNTKTSKRKRKELGMNCNEDLDFHQDCDSKAETLKETSLESEGTKTENLASNMKISKRKRKELEMNCNEDLDFHQDCDSKAENLTAFSKRKSHKKRKNSELSSRIRVESLEVVKIETELKNSNKIKQKLSENLDNGKFDENEKNCNSYRPIKKRKKSQMCENDATKMSSRNSDLCEAESSSSIKKEKMYSNGIKLSSENTVSEKSTKLEESSTVVNDQSSVVSLEVESSGNYTDCLKKKKKAKKKKLIQKLKSCLKNKIDSYFMKNVSFNETVSYRFIDSDIETVGNLSGLQGLNEKESSLKVFDVDDGNTSKKHSSDEEVSTNNQNPNVSSSTLEEISNEPDEDCSLSSMPSSKSPHYNYWIEDQRQALKMKIYKNMLKSIKKHKVLRTTNMLSIRGYGNWGFE